MLTNMIVIPLRVEDGKDYAKTLRIEPSHNQTKSCFSEDIIYQCVPIKDARGVNRLQSDVDWNRK